MASQPDVIIVMTDEERAIPPYESPEVLAWRDRTLHARKWFDEHGVSFSRHYTEQTGLTPGRAVERLRVEAARQLLLESLLPIKRISRRCGFGSEETMRRSFLRSLASKSVRACWVQRLSHRIRSPTFQRWV